MISTSTLYGAPPGSGSLSLGRTLPSLLDEACERFPNEQAVNQWHHRKWQSLSNLAFRSAAEEIALGLINLGLQQGDRVALVMHSDASFCLVDMGCLLAGLISVPIDLTQTIENILYILDHAAAKALIISNLDLLYQILPHLQEAPQLRWVMVAETPDRWEKTRQELICHPQKERETEPKNTADAAIPVPLEDCLQIPHLLGEAHVEPACPPATLPDFMQLLSLAEVQAHGQGRSTEAAQLRSTVAPGDLATILYIASETKRPKGVMLTHENISADILSAFSSYPNLEHGAKEVALLFLPLTHIFARAFFYGHLAYGHSIYLSDPNHVIKHLKTVNPTVVITVPRLLEKLYERILDQGQRLGKFDRAVFSWALKLAQRYELGQPPQKLYALQLKLADRLVFGKWRAVFGDRLKALICGGASLRAELANAFSAAGVPVLQGYGLTETSAVLCYNRGAHNRAGTVGVPIPGVEITLAADGEILIRGPFVMQGYYRDAEATRQVLSSTGWLHTGDLGEITPDGFLKITGVKKNLFKLSTGKYVSPLPLEQELNQAAIVSHAIAVGANHKFCGMLIFPDRAGLEAAVASLNLDWSSPTAWQHPCILALYQGLIESANCHLPYWSTVRKFRLITAELSPDLLLPDGSVNRRQALETFATEIELLYGEAEPRSEAEITENQLACPTVPVSACPTYARSLLHS